MNLAVRRWSQASSEWSACIGATTQAIRECLSVANFGLCYAPRPPRPTAAVASGSTQQQTGAQRQALVAPHS
eukprot:3193206-Amphidinium_carterae.1